jgi:hypothetical protein
MTLSEWKPGEFVKDDATTSIPFIILPDNLTALTECHRAPSRIG